jgi:hypothetical protein
LGLNVQFVSLHLAQVHLTLTADVFWQGFGVLARLALCQVATVRSSTPKAATIAGTGQPKASKVKTMTTCQSGYFSPYSGVPLVSAKVWPQLWQM